MTRDARRLDLRSLVKPIDVGRDLHHHLPRWARWIRIELEDLATLPKGARLLLLDRDPHDKQKTSPEG